MCVCVPDLCVTTAKIFMWEIREHLGIGKPTLISMNQKYSSYHNLIQCCSDFGFMPNIVLCTMENSLIYRFCQEKIGIGIDADVHPEKELLAGLRKIELYDAIPWKINLVCRKNTVNDKVISRLQEICCNLD